MARGAQDSLLDKVWFESVDDAPNDVGHVAALSVGYAE
jgi:hypothetical protein